MWSRLFMFNILVEACLLRVNTSYLQGQRLELENYLLGIIYTVLICHSHLNGSQYKHWKRIRVTKVCCNTQICINVITFVIVEYAYFLDNRTVVCQLALRNLRYCYFKCIYLSFFNYSLFNNIIYPTIFLNIFCQPSESMRVRQMYTRKIVSVSVSATVIIRTKKPLMYENSGNIFSGCIFRSFTYFRSTV